MIGYFIVIIVLPLSTFIIGYSIGHMQGYKDWKEVIDMKNNTICVLKNLIKLIDK